MWEVHKLIKKNTWQLIATMPTKEQASAMARESLERYGSICRVRPKPN